MRDPYSILGVTKSASAAEIKSAFRKLAKTCHPDTNKDDPKAQERFSEISRAYEIIGDEDKRKQFDRGEIDADGKEAFAQGYPGGNPFAGFDGFDPRSARRGTGGGAGINPEDILNSMFGSGLGRGERAAGADFSSLFGDPSQSRGRRASPPKGKDLEVSLKLTPADIIAGGKAKLKLADGRTVAVNLPKYVEDGTTIRLKGQGAAGPAGHRGDLLAKVTIASTERERVDGRTLIVDLDVPLAVAVTGGKATLATPDGKIAVKIAAWSSSGQTLRIKGRGLPLKSGGRGDLRARLQIVLDDSDRSELEKLFAAHTAE